MSTDKVQDLLIDVRICAGLSGVRLPTFQDFDLAALDVDFQDIDPIQAQAGQIDRVDLPGFGASKPPSGGLAIADYSREILAVLDHLPEAFNLAVTEFLEMRFGSN